MGALRTGRIEGETRTCIAAGWADSSSTARRKISTPPPASGARPSASRSRPSASAEDKNYVVFDTAPNELDIEVQKVDHPSRVHLDIETDNIEAEVERLEKLGAKRVVKIHSWWVMEAPTGQRFCVVNIKRSEFATEANVWK